jgi:hypothetical protein
LDLFATDESSSEMSVSKPLDDTPESKTAVSSTGTKLIDKEGKATGSVKFKTYITYLVACGGWTFIFWIAIGFIVTTSAGIFYLNNDRIFKLLVDSTMDRQQRSS